MSQTPSYYDSRGVSQIYKVSFDASAYHLVRMAPDQLIVMTQTTSEPLTSAAFASAKRSLTAIYARHSSLASS